MQMKHSRNNRKPASIRVSGSILPIIILSFALHLRAATFYVDPAAGSNANNGTADRPWKTLQQVIDSNKVNTRQPVNYPYIWGQPLQEKNAGAPVRGGDTILLRSGYHGQVTILRMYNTDWITIAADSGATPGLHSLLVQGSCKWRFIGLCASPELGSSTQKTTCINLQSHNYSGPVRDIVVERCLAYSALNVDTWDTATWKARSCNGIAVSARQVVIRNNTVKNVDFGISVSDDSVLVEGNVIDRFDGDGLRGVANDLTFRNNVVKNCIVANSTNHDDGFQSWSVGDSGVGTGTVYRVKLIGNTIVDYTDPSLPLKGTLQGIGCFDGMFEDWEVINNVVITDHWHGISLYGARNCRIINNTVCDINSVSPGPPWIMIADHKDSTPSRGCIVRNNLTTSLSVSGDSGMVNDHNIIIKDPNDYFVNYGGYDVRLKRGCAAIDSGTGQSAPQTDILGTIRPQGKGVDVGAYEFSEGQAVKHRVDDGSRLTVPRRVWAARNGEGWNLFIENTALEYPVNITLFDCRGVKIADFSKKRGPTIMCGITTVNSGLLLVKIAASQNTWIQPLVIR
jgi:parallel beta-helix repeat protein